MPKQNTNALKHGAYSGQIILPGESIEDFDELHRSLTNEWKPVGPIECDCIATLTKCLWRKHRLARYQDVKIERLRLELAMHLEEARKISQGDIDLVRGLLITNKEHPILNEEYLHQLLPENCAEYIRNAVQQKNYPDSAAWNATVFDKLENVLLPIMISVRVAEKVPELSPKKIEEVFNEDRLVKELQIEERIDAMIDRSVKRLIQAKALKEIINAKESAAGVHREGARQLVSANRKPASIAGNKLKNNQRL